jgi:hypothetical protein
MQRASRSNSHKKQRKRKSPARLRISRSIRPRISKAVQRTTDNQIRERMIEKAVKNNLSIKRKRRAKHRRIAKRRRRIKNKRKRKRKDKTT